MPMRWVLVVAGRLMRASTCVRQWDLSRVRDKIDENIELMHRTVCAAKAQVNRDATASVEGFATTVAAIQRLMTAVPRTSTTSTSNKFSRHGKTIETTV